MTANGVYKSTDSGSNWILSYSIPVGQSFRDIMFKPGDSSIIYASGINTFIRTIDGGNNWYSAESTYSNEKISLATDVNNPTHLYAYYFNLDSPGQILKKSTNSGRNWTIVNSSCGLNAKSWLSEIWVAPDGDIYAGGVTISRSVNGGVSFSSLNYVGHVDVRAATFPDQANPELVYFATDGGVFKSTNGGINSWSCINGDLVVSEIYDLDVTIQDPEIVLAGAHDNYTFKRNNDGTWTSVAGGDGGICWLNQSDHNSFYYMINKWLYKNGAFIDTLFVYDDPCFMDPIDNDKIYISTPANTSTLSYDFEWVKGSTRSLIANYPNDLDDLSFCDTEPTTMYYTIGNTWAYSRLFRRENSVITELNYSDIASARAEGRVTNIVVNPYKSNEVWITFGGFSESHKVYFSNDCGEHWTNFTGSGLPSLPIQCFEYDY